MLENISKENDHLEIVTQHQPESIQLLNKEIERLNSQLQSTDIGVSTLTQALKSIRDEKTGDLNPEEFAAQELHAYSASCKISNVLDEVASNGDSKQ